MEKLNSWETLFHWVSDHSDNFHDRLYDLIEVANDDQRGKIASIFECEVSAFTQFKDYGLRMDGFWDKVGFHVESDRHIVLESERRYRYMEFFDACSRCPNCKEELVWDAELGDYPNFITSCCGVQYEAYPTQLYLRIEKFEDPGDSLAPALSAPPPEDTTKTTLENPASVGNSKCGPGKPEKAIIPMAGDEPWPSTEYPPTVGPDEMEDRLWDAMLQEAEERDDDEHSDG